MNNRIHLDFLIIGAQKAGTTSLHDWLSRHDDIRLPVLKETHFFSDENRFNKGPDWYLEQFPSKRAPCLVGEIDPEYLFIEEAAAKIKQLTDIAKFLVVLRNPLQRAYSHYLMTVRRGFEGLPFDKAIQSERMRLAGDVSHFARDHQSYITRSLYSEQIERYLRHFPDGQFLFIKFDDLVDEEKSANVYKHICHFIGTTYDVNLVDRTVSSNQASVSRWGWLRDIIYRKGKRSASRKIVGSMLSDDAKLKLFMLIDKLNQKKLQKSEIKPLRDYDLDAEIVSELLADIDKVEHITGLSLQDWKASLNRC